MRSPHLSPEPHRMASLSARLDAAGALSVQAAERPDQQQDRDRHAEQPQQDIATHSSLHSILIRTTPGPSSSSRAGPPRPFHMGQNEKRGAVAGLSGP